MYKNTHIDPEGASQVARWWRIRQPMQETQEMQGLSLDREDPLEEEMAAPSSIPTWRIPWTEEQATVHGVTKQPGTTEQLNLRADPGTRTHITQPNRVTHLTFQKQKQPTLSPTLFSCITTDLNQSVGHPKDAVPKKGLFVFWVPDVPSEYKVGLHSHCLSLESLQIRIRWKKIKGNNRALRWDFHINTSEIVTCSLNFFLIEVYYLKVFPEVPVSIAFVRTEFLQGQGLGRAVQLAGNWINLCPLVKTAKLPGSTWG